jgi:CO/xanthine dehydrogenase Mo-binding subunit
VISAEGARAGVTVAADGSVMVRLAAGQVLDEVVLRSYVTGAVHQGLGWVTSEGLAVDPDGNVVDLTIRSFGILTARAMPSVTVVLEDGSGPPVRGSDAVFAATAGAVWSAAGFPADWPSQRGGER